MEDAKFNRLREIYAGKGICLGLGAGISVQSGIPAWNDLLKNIAHRIFDNDEVYNNFKKNQYSYQALASFLKSEAKPGTFTEIFREELYKNFKSKLTSRDDEQSFLDQIEKNPTLKSIGSFCAIKNMANGEYAANPKVHGIINFNIDKLLRSYTAIKFKKKILRTAERASAGRTPGKINVYHIHGMMRYETNFSFDNEAPDKLVFAEDEYYNLFNDPTNFFNYSFLYLLREYSFLFIGLSMQDLNLRRLLHLSVTEIKEAYQSEKLGGEKLRKKLRDANKHYTILVKPGSDAAEKFHEVTLLNLGVNVIWINSYAEISHKLKELYSVEADWGTVY